MNPRIFSFLRFRTSRLYEKLVKREHQSREQYFRKQGKRPWSLGYDEYKWEFITSIINDPTQLENFSEKKSLPAGFGMGLDERVIECPWVVSQLAKVRGTLLDAGSTLNYGPILHHPAVKDKQCIIVNLNPEKNCYWKDGISYVFADIRALPFKDALFDTVTCISTLEHIGMDNEIYTGPMKSKKQTRDYREAILELKRIMKPGGTLFVTVPFGQYQDFGFFQQFNEPMINDVIQTFGGNSANVTYYRYTLSGWELSTAQLCTTLKYFNVHETKYFDSASAKDFDNDMAAAARAVACVVLKK